MNDKMTPAQKLGALLEEHKQNYRRWEHLRDQGGQDPFNADGSNMALVRGHIIGDKRAIRDFCAENALDMPPDVDWELPPEVNRDYMARADEIRQHAREALVRYEADPDYRHLLELESLVDTKTAERVCLTNVLGYVRGLRMFIEQDSLIDMRRHEHPERYIESFRQCAARLHEAAEKPKENAQISFFEIMAQG